jgi:hypothetical protein
MTWVDWHKKSEALAAEAHAAHRRGDASKARSLFADAANAEVAAVNDLEPGKPRTLGITAVSAVSLMMKAELLDEAEALALGWLTRALPTFAGDQLRQLVQSIWTTRSMRSAGVSFLPGQVTIAVRGGQTVVGGAPLDLIVEKVQIVQNLFYRTIEYVKHMPHRTRGGPPSEIQEACRPWLFQAAPSSYQFAVAIQRPTQADFFDPGVNPEQIADRFMGILRASAMDPSTMPDVIPEPEYRSTFLKLARNLSPTGKNFGEIEVRGAGEIRGVVLAPENRKSINLTLRPTTEPRRDPRETQVELRGVLRGLQLDKDWLELTSSDGSVIRVLDLSEAVDDVIGPMVNHHVVVHAIRREMPMSPDGVTRIEHRFRDIEPEE